MCPCSSICSLHTVLVFIPNHKPSPNTERPHPSLITQPSCLHSWHWQLLTVVARGVSAVIIVACVVVCRSWACAPLAMTCPAVGSAAQSKHSECHGDKQLSSCLQHTNASPAVYLYSRVILLSMSHIQVTLMSVILISVVRQALHIQHPS